MIVRRWVTSVLLLLLLVFHEGPDGRLVATRIVLVGSLNIGIAVALDAEHRWRL